MDNLYGNSKLYFNNAPLWVAEKAQQKEWLILMGGYRMQCDFFVDEAIPSLNGI